MPNDTAKGARKLHRPNSPRRYDVGYAKPPTTTRFKPGQSGNPHGRPKGSRNKPHQIEKQSLQEIITAEANRLVKVNEGDKQVSISIATAVVRSIAVNAAKGQARSQKLFTDLLAKTEAEKRQEYEQNAQCVADYHMYWEKVFHHHRMNGLPLPNPAPHPHDVKFDESTGKIEVHGPITEEQRLQWEEMSDRVQHAKDCIAESLSMLAEPEHKKIKHFIEEDIARERKILAILEPALKGWRKRI